MRVLRWVSLGLFCVPIAAHALTFTLNTTSGGYNYKASAVFSYSGSTLTLLLTNTQNSNVVAAGNAQALTGLFWNQNTSGTGLTASAAGSFFGDGDGNVTVPSETPAQHWAWKSATPSFNSSVNFGVGAAGFGHFGNSDAFQGGGSTPVLNGVDWGLLGGNWNISGNQTPFIINHMTFTFNVGTGFNLNSINKVYFQYGSDFSEFNGEGDFDPSGDPVPEPGALAMLGFAGASLWARRKRTQK